MKRTTLVSMVSALLIAAPLFATAQTLDLNSQIQALVAQINQLQAQLKTLTGSGASSSGNVASVPVGRIALSPSWGWCPDQWIRSSYSIGMRGDDVMQLQQSLASRGLLPSTSVSGYYGSQTAAAVAKLQVQEGIVASSKSAGAGKIGPATQRHLRSWCSGMGSSNSYGFSAQPDGSTLVVTFSANVQVANGLPGAPSYKVVFGDGQEQQFECGTVTNVSPSDSSMRMVAPYPTYCAAGPIKHQYVSAGTYTAQLVTFNPSIPPINGVPSSSIIATQSVTVGDNAAGYVPPQSCQAWNDGCNVCSRSSPNGPSACTMRYCFAAGKGFCSAYFGGSNNGAAPTISGFSGPTSLSINQSGTWSINASDSNNGQLSYRIMWGDESFIPPVQSMTASTMPITQSTTFTHAYSRSGTFTVTITVSNQSGASSQSTATVVVSGGGSVACTMEYAPVCARQPGCVNTCQAGMACPAICQLAQAKTYGNACMARADGATDMTMGECTSTLHQCAADRYCQCDANERPVLCQ